jgi:hypothetical protein
MNKQDVIAIMSAILFAGPDCVVGPEEVVKIAVDLYQEAYKN